jgi:hypothetical protein
VEEAVDGGRGRWGAAIGLTGLVLALSVLDAMTLVLIPMAVLIIALPGERRLFWSFTAIALMLLAALFSSGPLALVSRGWALAIGAVFLGVTLMRPEWSVTARALAAATGTVGVACVMLLATGRVGELDALVREYLASVSAMTIGDLQTRVPDAAWLAELRAATDQIAGFQVYLFPSLLALQTIAALVLASWWIRRLGRSSSGTFQLGALKDFRFNDQLIWVLIATMILLLLPLEGGVERIAVNGAVFMAALYALRGFAVFVFLATGSRSVATMLLGALAFIVLYPVALTASLLMGLGDTWLDLRRRIAGAAST